MTSLVVETLEQRLHRLIPGAVLIDAAQRYRELGHELTCWAVMSGYTADDCTCPTKEYRPRKGEEFSVERDARVLAVGPSEREAVSRALFLFRSER